jgi:hypothetical protein
LKYKERDGLVAGLRELANFIEDRGLDLPIKLHSWNEFTLNTWFYESDEVDPKVQLQRAARVLGRADKNFQYSTFELTKKFGDYIKLKFSCDREKVCRKVVTGTKQVQKRVYVDIPNEFVNVEEVEWICDEPLLKSN